MKEFNTKRRRERLIYSKLSILLLLVLVFFMGKAGLSVFFKERESAANEEKARIELASLEARHAELQKEIDRLKTSEGVEEEIRKRYKVAREGEAMVVIIDDGEEEVPPVPPKNSIERWFSRMKSVFTKEDK